MAGGLIVIRGRLADAAEVFAQVNEAIAKGVTPLHRHKSCKCVLVKHEDGSQEIQTGESACQECQDAADKFNARNAYPTQKAMTVQPYYRTGPSGEPEFVHQYQSNRPSAAIETPTADFNQAPSDPSATGAPGADTSGMAPPATGTILDTGQSFANWFAGSHAAHPSGMPKPLFPVADEPGAFTDNPRLAAAGPTAEPGATVPAQQRQQMMDAALRASGQQGIDPEAAQLFTQSGDLSLLHPGDTDSPVWQAMLGSLGTQGGGPVYVSMKNPLYADRRVSRENLARMTLSDPPLLHAIGRQVMERTGANEDEWPNWTRGLDMVTALNSMGRDTDLPHVLARCDFDGMIHPAEADDGLETGNHYHIVDPMQAHPAAYPVVTPGGPQEAANPSAETDLQRSVLMKALEEAATPGGDQPTPLYSGLHRYLSTRLPEAAHPQLVQGLLKQGGFYNGQEPGEELAHSGLHQTLTEAGNQKLPKAQILDQVKRNVPTLLERHNQQPDEGRQQAAQHAYTQATGNLSQAYRHLGREEDYMGDVARLASGRLRPEDIHYPPLSLEQYRQQYGHLYGKDADIEGDWKKDTEFHDTDLGELRRHAQAFAQAHQEREAANAEAVTPTKWHGYVAPGGENYQEHILRLPERDDLPPYRHNIHWEGIDNPLIHLRTNERPNPEGGRDLHIEELQSDWHQQGKKHGYMPLKDIITKRIEHDALRSKLLQANMEFNRRHLELDRQHPSYQQNLLQLQREFLNPTIEDRYSALHKELFPDESDHDTPVPDAPFKTSWEKVGAKRALLEAAQRGLHRLTWGTGEQQARRYSLAQIADALYYHPEHELLQVKANDKEHDYSVPAHQLEGFVGKDAADALLASSRDDEGWHELHTNNLPVGGSGMKGFYGSIDPHTGEQKHGILGQYLNDYARRRGWNVRVGKTHYPELQDTQENPDTGERYEPKGNHAHAVHALEITPQMRDEILAWGLPLFGGEKANMVKAIEGEADHAIPHIFYLGR